MNNPQTIRLSPSTGLNLFQECPRCFWLHFNRGTHRPRGIFPSLPGGMDLIIKKYFDKFRLAGTLPPEIKGKVEGELVADMSLLNRWRNWRTGLEYCDKGLNAVLFGALDDCLTKDGKFIPLDYKTRGFAPRDGDSERYYQTQLDAYGLLLDGNGFPAGDFAYLIYYFPQEVSEGGIVKFRVEPVKVAIDLDRARDTFSRAVNFLRGPEPKEHSVCEYCSWVSSRAEFE